MLFDSDLAVHLVYNAEAQAHACVCKILLLILPYCLITRFIT